EWNLRSCPEMTTHRLPLALQTASCTVIVTPGRCSDMTGSPIASLKAERYRRQSRTFQCLLLIDPNRLRRTSRQALRLLRFAPALRVTTRSAPAELRL